MNNKTLTIQEVKSILPPVKISINEKIYIGITAGKKNKYCGVYEPETMNSFEYSWEAITRAVNNKIPLLT